jgi:hypothetical protein
VVKAFPSEKAGILRLKRSSVKQVFKAERIMFWGRWRIK